MQNAVVARTPPLMAKLGGFCTIDILQRNYSLRIKFPSVLCFAVADDVLSGAGRRVHDHEVPLKLPHLSHHSQHLPAGNLQACRIFQKGFS